MPELMKDFSVKFIRSILQIKDGNHCYRETDIQKKLDAIIERMKKNYPEADFSYLNKLPGDLAYTAPECAAQLIAERFWLVARSQGLDGLK